MRSGARGLSQCAPWDPGILRGYLAPSRGKSESPRRPQADMFQQTLLGVVTSFHVGVPLKISFEERKEKFLKVKEVASSLLFWCSGTDKTRYTLERAHG